MGPQRSRRKQSDLVELLRRVAPPLSTVPPVVPITSLIEVLGRPRAAVSAWDPARPGAELVVRSACPPAGATGAVDLGNLDYPSHHTSGRCYLASFCARFRHSGFYTVPWLGVAEYCPPSPKLDHAR